MYIYYLKNMMFRQFHKSRALAIFKSLSTSPAAICIYKIIALFAIIMIFYGIYLFNLYLLNEKTIYSSRNFIEGDAIILIIFEILVLILIILLSFVVYFAISDMIKCISDTKQKFVRDINEYECNAGSWQK